MPPLGVSIYCTSSRCKNNKNVNGRGYCLFSLQLVDCIQNRKRIKPQNFTFNSRSYGFVGSSPIVPVPVPPPISPVGFSSFMLLGKSLPEIHEVHCTENQRATTSMKYLFLFIMACLCKYCTYRTQIKWHRAKLVFYRIFLLRRAEIYHTLCNY